MQITDFDPNLILAIATTLILMLFIQCYFIAQKVASNTKKIQIQENSIRNIQDRVLNLEQNVRAIKTLEAKTFLTISDDPAYKKFKRDIRKEVSNLRENSNLLRTNTKKEITNLNKKTTTLTKNLTSLQKDFEEIDKDLEKVESHIEKETPVDEETIDEVRTNEDDIVNLFEQVQELRDVLANLKIDETSEVILSLIERVKNLEENVDEDYNPGEDYNPDEDYDPELASIAKDAEKKELEALQKQLKKLQKENQKQKESLAILSDTDTRLRSGRTISRT